MLEIFHLRVTNAAMAGQVRSIALSTSYRFRSAEDILKVTQGAPGMVYRRLGNDNTEELESLIAALEGAERALCLASGMAAISSAIIAAGVLSDSSAAHVVGDKAARRAKVLAPLACYGSTYALAKHWLANVAEVRSVDMINTESTTRIINEWRPDIVIMETCANPMTWVTDLPAIIAAAKAVGARTIVDNTYAVLLVRPLAFGATCVVHSATKFLSGHGDVLAGVLAGDAAFVARAHQVRGAHISS